MDVIADNQITLRSASYGERAEIKKMLTFANPEYEKRKSMGLWVSGSDSVIRLYKEIGNDLVVPFGMLGTLRDSGYKIQWGDGITLGERIEYGSQIKLFSYQEKAVNELMRKTIGVAVAPCGSGKTQMGLELIARLGLRALWITHTTDLLKQSMERAEKVFERKDFGTITSGKIKVSNSLTFATVQTLSKVDLSELRDYWDVIVVDECHHAVGTPTKLMMFYKVINSLCARYKFGLTATPRRSDGLTPCMYALIGRKAVEISLDEIKGHTCEVVSVFVDTGWEPRYDRVLNGDGTLNYTSLVSDCVENEARNNIIVSDIAKYKGAKLVLTERVGHAVLLAYELGKKEKAVYLSSSAKKEERIAMLNSIRNGEIQTIISTYSLAKEGLDIPNLEHVFMTTPVKNETTIVQCGGRVARKSPGKEIGVVHDYVDNMHMLRNWAKKRKKLYDTKL